LFPSIYTLSNQIREGSRLRCLLKGRCSPDVRIHSAAFGNGHLVKESGHPSGAANESFVLTIYNRSV
jgi:hypothetical protein